MHFSHVTTYLQEKTSELGLTGKFYGVKSLRKGGLAYAGSKGFSDHFCRALGTWSSNAIEVYRQTQLHEFQKFAELAGADINRHRRN